MSVSDVVVLVDGVIYRDNIPFWLGRIESWGKHRVVYNSSLFNEN